MSPQPPPRPNPKQESVNRHTYIPEHVRREMDKQMQKNLPAHLKQYSGAYMQQQVYDPSANRTIRPMQDGAPPTQYRPVTHLNREDHYAQYQNRAGYSDVSAAPEQATQSDHVTPEQAFDFIVNPEDQAPKKSFLPANSPMPLKLAVAGGALVLLLVIFSVGKGLLGGGSNFDSFISVAQDQQELIKLTTLAQQEQDLSVANENFSATANLSLSSAQSQIVTYLAKNGQKLKGNQLSLKMSSKTTTELDSAASAATYNDTYKQIMTTELNNYKQDLKQAYDAGAGPVGQELLNDQYEQAKLLLIQLDNTKS